MFLRYRIRWEFVALVIVVVIGLASRLHEIHYSLDGDEVFSVKLASKPIMEVISLSLQDKPHPPLYNILLHLWIKVFGSSEASVRALSISLSGAFILITYGLLCRLMSHWLALGMLFILAMSPLFVYYGQQARPYALIAFLSTANLLSFITVLEVPHDRRRLAIWATLCVLLLYAQYLAIVLITLQVALAFFCLRSDRLTICVYGSAASAFILPWFIAAMGGSIAAGADPLPHISWTVPPTLKGFVWFYLSVFGDTPVLQARWLLLAMLVTMLALLGTIYIRNVVASRVLPTSHVLLFIVGFGLPTLVYLVSVFGPKPVFASQQLLGSAVAFVAIIALCISALPRTWALGFLLIMLVWTAMALPQAFPHNRKPPWLYIAAQIDEHYGSRTVFTQEGWVSRPLQYYRKAGSVQPLDKLAEQEKDHGFLFACRPTKCSFIQKTELISRRSLLSTWQLGSNFSEDHQLRLYEIQPLTKVDCD